jgi:predicted DNA-binding mobile mystery protein A
MRATDRAARALDTRIAAIRLPDRPSKGWLRAVRDALGITTRQFATRLGVTQSRIVALERAETEGSVSLTTLRRAADALECTLVYALVPKRPLVQILRLRAEMKADGQLAHISHTMSLENQKASEGDLRRQRELLIDELLRGNLARLWDELP